MFKDFNIAQIGHPILRNKTRDIPINEIKSENTQKIIEKMINKKSIKKMLPKQKGDVQKSVNNKVREKRFYGFKYKISIEQGVKNFFEWYDKKEI